MSIDLEARSEAHRLADALIDWAYSIDNATIGAGSISLVRERVRLLREAAIELRSRVSVDAVRARMVRGGASWVTTLHDFDHAVRDVVSGIDTEENGEPVRRADFSVGPGGLDRLRPLPNDPDTPRELR